MSYGGYIGVYKEESGFVDLTDIPLVLGEVTYFIENNILMPYSMFTINRSSFSGYLLIVPDEALTAQNVKIESEISLLAMLKQKRYNARAMADDFIEIGIYPYTNYSNNLRSFEFNRLRELSDRAVWFIGCIFIALVFILISMAILAVKLLIMIEEDKSRYKTLWRIGADKFMILKSLLVQMLFHYFIPFILPVILFGPICYIILKIITLSGAEMTALTVFSQVIGIFGVIVALYVLYFTVTYLIARRDIKKSIRSMG